MEHWPAMERWQSPGYLKWVAGMRTVPVEVGRHYLAEGWGQRLMLLSDFIERHLQQPPGAYPALSPSNAASPQSSLFGFGREQIIPHNFNSSSRSTTFRLRHC